MDATRNQPQDQAIHPDHREHVSVAWLVLLAFAIIACVWGLDAGPPLSDHEAIVPQCARQIRQSGNWLIPYFNNVPFVRKAPLQFWLVAATSYLTDPTELTPPVSVLAARLPSAIAAILTVLVVARLGRTMYRSQTGLIAGAIMACCGGTLFFAHNAQTEMLLTFFIAAAMACFYKGTTQPDRRRRHMIGFYIFLALGMLAKAPMPLAMVVLPLCVYWFVTIPTAQAFSGDRNADSRLKTMAIGIGRQTKRLRELWLLPGIIIFLALTLPWPIYVYLKIDNALELWRTEFIDRYVGLLSDKVKPPWYYLPILFGMAVPFCLSLPEALVAPFRAKFKPQRAGMLFVLTWVVIQIAFLSTSAFKRPHYLLPVLPGACLLLAPVIDRLFFGSARPNVRRDRIAVLIIWAAALIGTPVGVYAIWKQTPNILWATYPAVAMLLGGIGLGGWLFRRQRRQASLVVLFVLPVILFGWTWSALGRSDFAKAQVKTAQALKRLGIGENDRITNAVGRPDARLSYYLGTQVLSLYSPLEIAARRRGRLEAPLDLLLEGAQRIADRLNSERKEYFIFKAKELDTLKTFVPIEYTEVLRVETQPDNPGKAIVVITNKWNTSERQ